MQFLRLLHGADFKYLYRNNGNTHLASKFFKFINNYSISNGTMNKILILWQELLPKILKGNVLSVIFQKISS